MTQEQAQKLGSYVLDSGLDATILTLGRGDEFCVRIQSPQWHCFDWSDWNAFAAEQKKVRNKRRKAEDRAAVIGIDPTEVYRLVLFA